MSKAIRRYGLSISAGLLGGSIIYKYMVLFIFFFDFHLIYLYKIQLIDSIYFIEKFLTGLSKCTKKSMGF